MTRRCREKDPSGSALPNAQRVKRGGSQFQSLPVNLLCVRYDYKGVASQERVTTV